MENSFINKDNGSSLNQTLPPFLDIKDEINSIKERKNALILAHFYQSPEIQDIADFVGDSLDLSRKATETEADMIAFCGVKFMGESAKILNPDKIVVIPDEDAGCSLEDSCETEEFKAFISQFTNSVVITYINSSAEVKALSDIIVTSSNAEAIILQIPENKNIVFGPDKHLGGYLSKKTGRKMELWPGTCIVHEQFNERELVKLMTRHLDSVVAAHPECHESILRHADHVGSTRSILDFVIDTPAHTVIIATEQHIIHQMKKSVPSKNLIPAPGEDGTCSCANCPYMAMNSLEKLYFAMKNETPKIELPEKLRLEALRPLKKMLDMSPKPATQNRTAA